jgi:hypothetical protein
MQRVANAALAVIATVGALNTILRPHLGFRYHSLSAFVPRLLVGAILVNTALWWVQFAIDVNNAMAASIGDATPPNWNSLNGPSGAHGHRAWPALRHRRFAPCNPDADATGVD